MFILTARTRVGSRQKMDRTHQRNRRRHFERIQKNESECLFTSSSIPVQAKAFSINIGQWIETESEKSKKKEDIVGWALVWVASRVALTLFFHFEMETDWYLFFIPQKKKKAAGVMD